MGRLVIPAMALLTAGQLLACSSDDSPRPWLDAPILTRPFTRPARPAIEIAGLWAEAQIVQPCAGVAGSSDPMVLCVRASAETAGDGTADNPLSSIQEAIDQAQPGTIIQVAAGDYQEALRVEGRSIDLRGGFDDTFAERIPATHLTSIDASSAEGSALAVLAASTVRLSGFRLTGGHGLPDGDGVGAHGGGLSISESSVTIEHNLIEDNDVTSAAEESIEYVGGGVLAHTNSSLELLYNVIRANRAGRGAGVAAFGGTQRIVGNEIRDNVSVGDHGGGLYLAGPSIEVLANTIVGNTVGERAGYGWGGGVLVFDGDSQATLAYDVIQHNSAPDSGSGVFIDDGAQALLSNELINSNACGSATGAALYIDGLDPSIPSAAMVVNTTLADHPCGDDAEMEPILIEQGSALVLRNSIIWDSGRSGPVVDADETSGFKASYSLAAAPLQGPGNLSLDPLFADPATEDFHLRSTAGRFVAAQGQDTGTWVDDGQDSPGIDAGDPNIDVGVEPEPNGGRINMGAFGGTDQASHSP